MSFAAIISLSVRCCSLSTVSDVFPYVGHGRTSSAMLAVPAVPVEENEVYHPRFSVLLFNPKNALHRSAFSAHPARVPLGYPDLPRRRCFRTPAPLRDPPFCWQRNSMQVHHLRRAIRRLFGV